MRNKTQGGRRTFLKNAAIAGSAATVVLGVDARQTPSGEAASQAEAGTAKGYHVTPHIENYYRLARD